MDANLSHESVEAGHGPVANLCAFGNAPETSASEPAWLAERAAKIRCLDERASADLVEIGRVLIEVQERLRYRRDGGGFVEWLKDEFNWSRSAAYRFIDVAKMFPTSGNIPPGTSRSAAYALAAGGDASAIPSAGGNLCDALQAAVRLARRLVDAEGLTGTAEARAGAVALAREVIESLASPPPDWPDLSGIEACHCPDCGAVHRKNPRRGPDDE